MDSIKHSPEGAVAYGILGLIGLTPPQVEQRLVDLFSSKSTAVLTNVPGPREPIYFAGTRIAGVVGWVPAAGAIGLGGQHLQLQRRGHGRTASRRRRGPRSGDDHRRL